MKSLVFTGLVAILFASCSSGEQQEQQKKDVPDTLKQADSIPKIVRVGKEADWAYKPDSCINEIVLGDAVSFANFSHKNGAEGETNGDYRVLHYFNGDETEFLSVYTVKVNGKNIPYGLCVAKNSDSLGNNKMKHDYALDRNFLSGHGIYIGMPIDYVQNVYKSQPMMTWIKGDTTYLAYAPSQKDEQHFKRYPFTQYSATYKFVNDQCRVIEMMVDPEAFDKH